MLAGVAFGALIVPAMAADMPVKAPIYNPPSAAVASNNFYFWLDGVYDRVGLPTYALGLHLVNMGPFTDTGQTVQSFDPSVNGGGLRGAIGYAVPETNVRLELGGSSISAKGTASQTTATSNDFFVMAQLMNGSGAVAFSCGFLCTTAGSLSTSYDAWQINGKIATDLKYGSITVTPSAALIGGNTGADQNLSQTFIEFLFPRGSRTGAYSANTALHWTDFGGRVGLDVNAPVTQALSVGIGGWVGGVDRSVSLSGSDTATSTPIPIFNGASSLSSSDSKSVLLANAEVGFAYQFMPALTFRGFVGVNYDGSVPGITNPTFTGSVNAPTSATPAQIYYAQEATYYAGGGFKFRF
jgi:hypothetical protein